MKLASPATANPMPILAPRFCKSGVNEAKQAGNRLWIPAQKKPKKSPKAHRPGTLSTAAQENAMIPLARDDTVIVVTGPIALSAMKLGRSRPRMLTPFMPSSKEMDAE